MPRTPVDPIPAEVSDVPRCERAVEELAPTSIATTPTNDARPGRVKPTWESLWDTWDGSSGIKGTVFAVSVLVLLSISGSAEMIPSRALVIVDPASRTYNAPACALGAPTTGTTVRTKQAAEQLGYKPNAACWSSGGFLGAGGSRWMDILRSVKLYPAKKSRWRDDGTWRW